MAEFNFKITEDARPGGGVYMIGNLSGGAKSITIAQADYPNVDLSTLTKNNFFLRTVCNASATASVRNNNNDWCNTDIHNIGGSTGISGYSYANGKGTLTISETLRGVQINLYQGDSGQSERYGSYSHKVYMSKSPIR